MNVNVRIERTFLATSSIQLHRQGEMTAESLFQLQAARSIHRSVSEDFWRLDGCRDWAYADGLVRDMASFGFCLRVWPDRDRF
jgi:hypothetical protein